MKQEKKALQTTLDSLPWGDTELYNDLKVSNKLPQGVKSKALYKDSVHIAWPSFIELLLTQLVSMVDMMMVGGIHWGWIAGGLGGGCPADPASGYRGPAYGASPRPGG